MDIKNTWCHFPHTTVQITKLSIFPTHYCTNDANISLFFWSLDRICFCAWSANPNLTEFVLSYVPIDMFWWLELEPTNSIPPTRIESRSLDVWPYSHTPSWFGRSSCPLRQCLSEFITRPAICLGKIRQSFISVSPDFKVPIDIKNKLSAVCEAVGTTNKKKFNSGKGILCKILKFLNDSRRLY